jgi:hypothetical protein
VKGLAGLMLSVVRLKPTCGVFGGSPENCRVPRLLHKAENDDLLVLPQNHHQAWTTWRPSHEWDLARRLHQVRVVCGSSPQNCRGYLVEPQNQDRRLGGWRRDPGAPRSFEAGDTRHDQGACIGRTRRPDGCAVIQWRNSCVDQNAYVRT